MASMEDPAGEAAARAATEEWAVPLGERRPTFASMAFETTHLFLGTAPEVLALWFLFEVAVLGGIFVLLTVPSPELLLTDTSGNWLASALATIGQAGYFVRLPILIVVYFVVRTPVAGAVAAYGAARQRRADVRFRTCLRASVEHFPQLVGGSLLLGASVAILASGAVAGIATLAGSADTTGVLTAGFLLPAALLVGTLFFYAASGLSLWTPAAMMEDLGPRASVARGWALSRSFRWSLGAAYLVLESLALAVTWILLAFVGWLGTLGVFTTYAGLLDVLVALVVALPLLGAALMESLFTLGSASAYNLIVASAYTRSSEGAGAFEPPTGYGPSTGSIARRP